MALNDNRRQGVRITGRTWFCIGTTMVVMGTVVLVAVLVLPKQLPDSKCNESSNCISQLQYVKAGISFAITIVFYGLFTVLVGLCRRKEMVLMLAILSVLSAMFALTLLVISEVNIVSSFHQNMSTVYLPFMTSKGPCSELFKERRTEMNKGLQVPTSGHGDLLLRFFPSDEAIQLEHSLLREGFGGSNWDQKSSSTNDEDDHKLNSKYRHELSTYNESSRTGSGPEIAKEPGRGVDQHRDLWNLKFSGGESVDFEEMLNSSAETSSSRDGARTTTTAALTSETREAEKASNEGSAFGEGFSDAEEIFLAAENRRETDSYSELEDDEDSKTTEGRHLSVSRNSYEDDFRGTRGKTDRNEGCTEVEEEIFRQLMMSCLMAIFGVIVLVMSIVTATLAFAPFCCYQKDKKTNTQKSSRRHSVTPAAAAGKDEDDVHLLSDNESLLQV